MFQKIFLLISLVLISFTIQAKSVTLIVKKVQITVNGRTSEIYRLEQPDGKWGISAMKGEEMDILVKNKINQPVTLHWHGLIVPSDQDGVPGISQQPIQPGKSYHYRFKLTQSGTYWVHSHVGLQTQKLLSAPFIIFDPADSQLQNQEALLFLTDFTFKNPNKILKEVAGMDHAHHHHITDVNYDAYLANYRTLSQPYTVKVEPRKILRLRIIDGSAASNFLIDLGKLSAKLIAVDGQKIIPVYGSQFHVATGQRLDLLINMPDANESYPILAKAEGTHQQTGIILVTPEAKLPKLKDETTLKIGSLDYSQELKLTAIAPLIKKKVDRVMHFNIENKAIQLVDSDDMPIKAGDRVELVLNNNTDMSHPMHLHGHIFEVTEIDGKKMVNGAMRDTLLVLPHSTVKIQFNAIAGDWMLHCHMLYHQESGMMTQINIGSR